VETIPLDHAFYLKDFCYKWVNSINVSQAHAVAGFSFIHFVKQPPCTPAGFDLTIHNSAIAARAIAFLLKGFLLQVGQFNKRYPGPCSRGSFITSVPFHA
jgi:hypothetical protein